MDPSSTSWSAVPVPSTGSGTEVEVEVEVVDEGDVEASLAGSSRINETEPEPEPNPRKRKTRLRTTCQACQRTKSKCIKGEGPACLRCSKRGEACEWDPIQLPSKLDTSVVRKIEHFEKRLAELEARLSRVESEAPTTTTEDRPIPKRALHPSNAEIAPAPAPAKHAEAALTKGAYETEVAAAALEDLALGGRRQYGALGLNSEDPGASTRGNEVSAFPGYFTSIISKTNWMVRPRARAQQLIACLPSQILSTALNTLFFRDISWAYRILHTPTFLQEEEQFWMLFGSGEIGCVDPAWLSCWFMVKATAAAHIPFNDPAVAHMSEQEVAGLSAIYFDTAHAFLEIADWASKPQARVVQAILLKIAYLRPSDPSAGSSFFVWLSVAIRQCQILGLHRLGSDPSKMPIADPAWPAQPCSLSRNLAQRLWFWTLSQDWMFNNGNQLQQIGPNGFDTAVPANVNEQDLGLHTALPEYPPHYLTDSSYSNVLFVLAQFQTVASGLSQQSTQLRYDTILKLHAGLEKELAKVTLMASGGSSPTNRPYLADLLKTVFHNRIIRLHRPFFMKGMYAQTQASRQYAESVKASIESAAQVCKGLEALGLAGLTGVLWYVPAYGMSAAIVLFVSLLVKEQKREDTTAELLLLEKIRTFFSLGIRAPKDQRIPASSVTASKQAVRAIERFLQARLDVNNHGSDRITEVFRKVSQQLTKPPSRRPSVSHRSAEAFGQPSHATQLNPSFLDDISTSFPTLQLFGQQYARPAPSLTFEDDASRQALVSLSTFELTQTEEQALGGMDWATLIDL